jgi:alpha-L-fucosidase 2
LLPALPVILKNGSIKGICARGGFNLDLQWKDGKLEKVTVYSKAGNQCLLRYQGKEKTLITEKGKTYQLNGNLEKI